MVWNAQHEWITFAKQFGRVAAHELSPMRTVEFLGTQFLLLTPLIAIYAVKGVRPGLARRGPGPAPST